MKRSLISIFFIVFVSPCASQWKTAGFNGPISAFGRHDTSFFISSPGLGNGASVDRFIPTGLPGSYWVQADIGIDFTQGNITTFASLGPYFFASTAPGHIAYSTTNNGSFWSEAGNAGPIATNGTYLFGQYLSAISRSKDSGKTWTHLDSAFQVGSYAAIGAYIFAAAKYGVYRSTDSGNTWSKISPPFTGTMTVMDTLLFIVGSGKLAESTDSGTLWNMVPVDSGSVQETVNVLATDGKNLFAGTTNGVYVSTDIGKSWRVENTGLTYLNVSELGVFDTLLFVNTPSSGAPDPIYYTAMRPISEMTDTTKSAVQTSVQTSTTLAVYPNPMNNSTTITYSFAKPGLILIEIVDALGRTIALPISGVRQDAGTYSIDFDASTFPSGTYWCELSTGSEEKFAKLVIVK